MIQCLKVIKLEKSKEELQIIEIIDQIKPFLMADGGDVSFVKYEDNIVYIKLLGACQDCEIIDVTLKDVIETNIMEEVPSVKEVRLVEND